MATFQVVSVHWSSRRRQSQQAGPASRSSGIHSEGRERTICMGRFGKEFPGCFPSIFKQKLILWKDGKAPGPLTAPELTSGHAHDCNEL